MHTFEEWDLLITAPTEGDEFQILEDWETERDMFIKETAKMAGRTAKLIEALEEVAGYKQEDGLCWCFDPYTNPNKHDACCLKARAVLEEVQHKDGE